ncbi:Hypothetical protein R9X50_00110200 [Acrodontium crateriforme]|uniref:Elongation factor 1 alpha-like protein n=1 Tax=Acrodontium crateriforme TaxID=150365 RepID=A0AAQ3LYS4_9PEZI|nr:Hypothetical protein R9X50_00110200 [Acrodontium crateriforme]
MQRVKNLDYDSDDLYSDDENDYDNDNDQTETYSAEDKHNFSTLTPVVRAELEEADVNVSEEISDKDIHDSLWFYYWDVEKCVAYLKNGKGGKKGGGEKVKEVKTKTKSKFELAAERSAVIADSIPPPLSAAEWFRDIPWTNVPLYMTGELVLAEPAPKKLKLLGGSSKLAKLAEERRRKAAAAAAQAPPSTADSTLSALDRLSKPKDANHIEPSTPKPEPKRYPIRKKREPTPPPRETTPPPVAHEEETLDLRAPPTAFGRALSMTTPHGSGCMSMALTDILGSDNNDDPFKGPSPDDTAEKSASTLEKKTEALKLESSGAPAAPQVKIKSKGLDVPALWTASEGNRKKSAAFVVIGHVDHGKSTLMGRLLLDTGAVAQRDIDRYKKQATEMGKASFALAWVMDTGSEERERGVTVDIAQHHFSTEKVDFTILDAPGHRDFVPNMIGGAAMADLAVLVVDANQLESGLKGQTREHILLARAVGLKRIIVAVNKLDSASPPWNKELFDSVSAVMARFLESAGFSEDDIAMVPCSGLNGENVVKPPPASGASAWVAQGQHRTLLDELSTNIPPPPSIETMKGPVRLQIADVFRGGITNPLSIAGRLSSGSLQTGDTIIIQPSGEKATIKSIEVNNHAKDWTIASQICTLHISPIDPIHLRTGDLLTTPTSQADITQSFTARLTILDSQSLLPQSVDLHLGRQHLSATITQLLAIHDVRTGEIIKRKPRVVKSGQCATVRFALNESIPLLKGMRVVLRSGGVTLASGFVEKVGI